MSAAAALDSLPLGVISDRSLNHLLSDPSLRGNKSMYDAVDPRRMITPHASRRRDSKQVPIPLNRKHFSTAPEKSSSRLSLVSPSPSLVKAKKSFPSSTHFTCVAPLGVVRSEFANADDGAAG